ncbi:MAG: NAD-dependent epimerase/dehydratase family protein [Acidimicrobiia bacterium]|nr:NAD-dependent epimerase/dehydratase family protein [Acidimicrobiia bacterium]
MKVVVTGGAGFIGANLCRELSMAEGFEVVAVDDLSTGCEANLEGVAATTLVEGSILDHDLMSEVLDGADSIVHLAARPSVPRSITDPMASHHVNATGTIAMLEAARAAGVPHVVVASSSSVYGANPVLPKSEDMVPRPVSPYAASKLAAEAYAAAYGHSFGVGTLALRLFNVFGPRQPAGHAYAAVIPAFVSAALEGRPLPLHGDGKQTRDFTYVGSVTAVIAAAVSRGLTSTVPVNLAFGTRRSLLDVIEAIEVVLGDVVDIEHHPGRAGDVRHSQADETLLRSSFPGIEPIDFHSGLSATVDWFRSSAR